RGCARPAAGPGASVIFTFRRQPLTRPSLFSGYAVPPARGRDVVAPVGQEHPSLCVREGATLELGDDIRRGDWLAAARRLAPVARAATSASRPSCSRPPTNSAAIWSRPTTSMSFSG